MNAVLRYPGAKWSMAERIVAEFGDHYHYVEPFFGSGAVFFTKPASPHEVINDRHALTVNLFRTLRNHTEELCWSLETTPWARDEYAASFEVSGDPIEDARRFVVRCWQAHASDLAKRTGWKSRGARQRARGMSDRWARVPEQLRSVAHRLADAEIENRDAVEVIARHNGPDVLVYADPPYLAETRTQQTYAEEMSEEQHHELLATLLAHQGPVVVSGYAHPLYDERLRGWRRIEMQATKTYGSAVHVEVLWVSQ